MAHGSALVSSRHIGTTPLSVRARTLSGLSIGAGVRVICLCCASTPIRSRNPAASRISAGVRIVTGTARRRSVRPISSLFPSVSSRRRVIVRRWIMITVAPVIRATVCPRVGIVVATITIWWPPIATPIGKNRSRGSAQNECA